MARKKLQIVNILLASCFGLGRLPIAPGTWGSLPSVVVFVVTYYTGASLMVRSVTMAFLVLMGSFICVKSAPLMIAKTGNNDPAEVVIDELAGQAVTFLFTPMVVKKIWIVAVLGFLLFRVFDIVKPWPCHKLEKLKAGWGILMDDLFAGIYAAIVLLVLVKTII